MATSKRTFPATNNEKSTGSGQGSKRLCAAKKEIKKLTEKVIALDKPKRTRARYQNLELLGKGTIFLAQGKDEPDGKLLKECQINYQKQVEKALSLGVADTAIARSVLGVKEYLEAKQPSDQAVYTVMCNFKVHRLISQMIAEGKSKAEAMVATRDARIAELENELHDMRDSNTGELQCLSNASTEKKKLELEVLELKAQLILEKKKNGASMASLEKVKEVMRTVRGDARNEGEVTTVKVEKGAEI